MQIYNHRVWGSNASKRVSPKPCTKRFISISVNKQSRISLRSFVRNKLQSRITIELISKGHKILTNNDFTCYYSVLREGKCILFPNVNWKECFKRRFFRRCSKISHQFLLNSESFAFIKITLERAVIIFSWQVMPKTSNITFLDFQVTHVRDNLTPEFF